MANNSKISGGDIAKGAAAVTIAAGVVAAGVLLSDKKNRKKVGKFAQKGMEMARDVAHEISDQAVDKYQEIQAEAPEVKSKLENERDKLTGKTKKTKTSS